MFFFFKQKTAYEMRISDWSSDVCSSDLGLSELDLLMRALLEGKIEMDAECDGNDKDEVGEDECECEVEIEGEKDAEGDDEVESEVEIGRASCRERVCQYV